MHRRNARPLLPEQARRGLPTVAYVAAITALVSACVFGCHRSSGPARSNNATGASSEAEQTLSSAVDAPPETLLGEEPQNANSARDQQRPKTVLPAASGVDALTPARPRITPAGANGILDITFDDLALDIPLGTLFDPTMLTPRVRQLDGKQVRLRGFIFAGGVFQSSGIKSFPFVMNTQCKFGPQGLAYCVILVELAERVTTDFTTYPITVEGKLSIRPFNADGFTWSVYHMRGTKVF